MLVFFTNLILMEFQVIYLTLFLLFSVIDGFQWFWVGGLHKNIQLMLEFLEGSFLFFFNWDSLHARLKSHYKAWSYTKKKRKKIDDTGNVVTKSTQSVGVCYLNT